MKLYWNVWLMVGLISISGLILSSWAVPSHAQGASQGCGEDVIELYGQGDPQTRALYKHSRAEFEAKWLERKRCMAEQGDAKAQLSLGIVYRDGSDGPPQDYTEAAKWFHKAAEQKNAMAQFNLGRLYENGHGVPQDYVKAHMWCNVAVATFGSDGKDSLSRMSAFKRREALAARMTSQQIAEAHKLAREWWEKANK
jgi:TPR repeat protein